MTTIPRHCAQNNKAAARSGDGGSPSRRIGQYNNAAACRGKSCLARMGDTEGQPQTGRPNVAPACGSIPVSGQNNNASHAGATLGRPVIVSDNDMRYDNDIN
jgi:hypothetical protein